MKKTYRFNSIETENIINRFGKSFYNKVLTDISAYSFKWNLSIIELIQSYSANLVFKCYSDDYGDALLKIGVPATGGILTEYNTLLEYNGKPFCKVYEADLSNNVMLAEWIHPGTPLRDEDCLDKRLSVFLNIYRNLHKEPSNSEIYPTYTEWVIRITEYMSSRQDCPAFYLHMQKAKEICLSISKEYSRRMLLHGDFHHDNILLGSRGDYMIIDPKGVIGDPVFDIPRFILNEFGDDITPELYTKINRIISNFEANLNIPNEVIRKCLYIETVMGTCWCLESGATIDEYPKLMESITFAESIMDC